MYAGFSFSLTSSVVPCSLDSCSSPALHADYSVQSPAPSCLPVLAILSSLPDSCVRSSSSSASATARLFHRRLLAL